MNKEKQHGVQKFWCSKCNHSWEQTYDIIGYLDEYIPDTHCENCGQVILEEENESAKDSEEEILVTTHLDIKQEIIDGENSPDHESSCSDDTPYDDMVSYELNPSDPMNGPVQTFDDEIEENTSISDSKSKDSRVSCNQ